MHTHAVKPTLGAELELQVSHALVVVPRTEKVPAAQASTMASAVSEHCVVMRFPEEVPVHVLGHAVTTALVPYSEGVLAAEYLPDPHAVHVRSPVLVAAAE